LGLQPELPESSEAIPVSTQNQRREEDVLRELYFERLKDQVDGIDLEEDPALVRQVIRRAQRVVAHPARPYILKTELFKHFPFEELDIEESLEESWDLSNIDDLKVQVREERSFQCVAMLDCSSSMSGDKHLTASIAVAVLLIKIASKDAGVLVFHSNSQQVKGLMEEESAERTVLNFLKVRPKGFTNIALGLEKGLENLRKAGAKKRIGLIATDGRSTQGKDPLEFAKQYDCLIVLHLHGPGSYLEASQKMATEGHGICLEVEEFEDLPHRMYEAIRLLAHR
jgi:hypothetical protein